MQPIVSGTTTERILRSGVLLALSAGYCAWSLWDGYVAYPRVNMVAILRDKAGVEPGATLPDFSPNLTEREAETVKPGITVDELVLRFGKPAAQAAGSAYFVGHGGFLKAETSNAKVVTAAWQPGPKHTAADLALQRIIGFVLLPVAMLALAHFLRVLLTRAVLTPDELRLGRSRPIPLQAIMHLGADPRRPGRYQLTVRDAADTRIVELDDYIIRHTGKIVAAICQLKGWSNPSTSQSAG